MNDDNYFPIFILGFIIGAVAGVGVSMTFPALPWHIASVALEECELNLPRNQHCVITASPQGGFTAQDSE